MPIKSCTEASSDEQWYQAQLYNRNNSRFVFQITGQTTEIFELSFFSPYITPAELFSNLCSLFVSARSVHKTSNYFNYTENSSIQSSSLVNITRSTGKNKTENPKETDATFS